MPQYNSSRERANKFLFYEGEHIYIEEELY